MCKTGMVSVILICLLTWAAPVMSADQQVAEENVTQTEGDFQCSHPERWTPTQAELEKILADHLAFTDSLKSVLITGDKNFDDERRADLCNAILPGVTLSDAFKAMGGDRVYLPYAKLNGADLRMAWLNGAYLYEAELNGADLWQANLNGVDLSGVELGEAFLAFASLREVNFEPTVLPQIDGIADAFDLFTMKYDSSPRALFSLRSAFRDAGFRNQERAITHAIKKSEMRLKENIIEKAFNFVLFDLTTKWGMSPGRPLQVLGVIILLFTGPYIIALRMPSSDGIWRVWIDTRIRTDLGSTEPEKLQTGGWKAVGLGFYFSVLSAFQIGWRDLNVGNWIARIQRREYTLRATGWARTVAGFQSVLSVYLLAMSALTYFGRPFG